MDVVRDYDCEILYHLRKANVVADALICKETGTPILGLYMRITITSPLLDFIK